MKYFILLFFFTLIFSCKEKEKEDAHRHHQMHDQKVYTCPMHPEIIRNQPGKCPICGMELIEKKETGISEDDSLLNVLLKPTNEFVIGKIKTTRSKEMEFENSIEVTGKISYDPNSIHTISARVSGRIEKLYVKYEFQPVYVGQKLMDIYSKDLLNDQENLLFLMKNDSENSSMIAATEKKLLLQGLNTDQIEWIKKNRSTINFVSIYSPYSGHLHSREINETKNDASNNMSMPNPANSTRLLLSEGEYVEKGQNIFTVYGTDKIWVLIDLLNESGNSVQKGMPVSFWINGFENKIHADNIDFIEPILEEGQKSFVARIYLDNPQKQFKIGMLVSAKIELGKRIANFIPATAIVHLGQNEMVFVKEGKYFRSKQESQMTVL
jgi:Cu(I)/Ag(I) efflux system membrane fusion protein